MASRRGFALLSESDRTHDRQKPCGRVTDEKVLEAGRHHPNRSTMLEDVTHGDEYREAEEDEGFDAMPVLLVNGGSRGGLGLRDLRLMGTALSRFLLTRQLSSATSTLVGHEHSSSGWVNEA